MLIPQDRLRQLGLALFDIGAFKDKAQSPGHNGFKLKMHETNPGAPLSPYYMNLRTPDNPKPGPLTPAIISEIGELLYLLASDYLVDYHAVAGVPNAGDPLAESFSRATMTGIFAPIIKLQKADRLQSRNIAGISVIPDAVARTSTVLLVDDLITAAHSKLEAKQALELSDFFVTNVVVVIDREEGGTDELRNHGCELHALFTMSELLRLYFGTGRISRETFDEINAYRRQKK